MDFGASWRANPELVQRLEGERPDVLYREENVPPFVLPEAVSPGDTLVTWETRRRRLRDLFAEHLYGRSPQGLATTGRAETVGRDQVRLHVEVLDPTDRRFAFTASINLPFGNEAHPAILLIDHREAEEGGEFWPVSKITAAGFAAIRLSVWDVDPDDWTPEARARGARGVWPGGGDSAWGSIAAWGWGASRVLDALVAVSQIDPNRVALIGHSRGGKAALWAAANDPRFALVVANQSGCLGAALSRRQLGETIGLITSRFPHWFAPNAAKYSGREADLPVDQHQLLALVAPKPLYIGSADEDLWADPRGEYLALMHASPAYGLHDPACHLTDAMPPVEAPLHCGGIAYHVRRGGHDLNTWDWHHYLDFAARRLRQ
jgi:pimeloyl-ACP methyl ester carboxylesterase